MLRKWTILGVTMAAVTVLATGFSMAQDEDSPLHKLMEEVNKKNLAITKGVRTAVAFKKSQKVVAEAPRSSSSSPRKPASSRSRRRSRSSRTRSGPS